MRPEWLIKFDQTVLTIMSIFWGSAIIISAAVLCFGLVLLVVWGVRSWVKRATGRV